MTAKTYPRKCFNCRKLTVSQVFQDTTLELQHDGRPLTVAVPGLEAEVCSTYRNRT